MIIIKWLAYMLPVFAAQIFIAYLFNFDHQITWLPVFIILSLINIIAYHIFLVPKKVKNQLSTFLFGKQYANDFAAYEDILTEIIEGSKARQAAYDGYRKKDLVELLHKATTNEQKYKFIQKIVQLIFIIWVAGVIFYNLFMISGFQFEVLFLQWGTGLAITIINHYIGKRRYHWGQDTITLKRCIEKCKDDEIFCFDNEF